MAVTPKWLGALASFIALAALFGGLSQWQIGRAVEQATIVSVDTETPVSLSSVVAPGEPVSLVDGGRKVTVRGVWNGPALVVTGRHQGDAVGDWLLKRVMVQGDVCLPVVVGFGEHVDPNEFIFIDDTPQELTGRLVPTEDPSNDDATHNTVTAISSAALINEWGCDRIYAGYLVLDTAPAPLQAVDTVRPLPQATLNWLNIFYAAEWIFFAGFSLYFWYRLVLDAVERETENAAAAQP